jgi:predicted CoA-substrate-specific enzyme activase
MGILIGLDVGSVSVKLAATGPPQEFASAFSADNLSGSFRIVPAEWAGRTGLSIVISEYQRTFGNPLQTALGLLEQFRAAFCNPVIQGVRVTGLCGRQVAAALEAPYDNEFKAIARGTAAIYPRAHTIFEIGGENSKYILLDPPNGNGHARPETQFYGDILDYSTSGECAAGTGSFLDQQASRLKFRVEEIGAIVSQAKSAARIAGRCSVFAKSDMIHAQQKGYGADEVLKGLCEAVARNFKSNIVRGKKVVAPVALVGGVSQNAGVVQALEKVFHLNRGEIFVPELYAWLGAIGAVLVEDAQPRSGLLARDRAREGNGAVSENTAWAAHEPLSLENILLLRDHPQASRTEPLPEHGAGKLPVFLGIDIGSVSTNLALLDASGRLLHGIYLRTSGRPIEVVQQGLQEIDQRFGSRIEVRGVGTTGSGRELIGELVGADTVNDEITAHKTGATYVHETLVRRNAASPSTQEPADGALGPVDTIFEIGGQDSKFISLDRGVVVDFAMNEACAAGTGSFLEEQAERLGIQIKDEFARLALTSRAPVRLGERCTVFMERDVTGALQRGAKIEDVTAGLAYSVALNYLNRVVRGRRIGKVIYFQGGTAYNDAVAAAFSMILGKRILVPPHNGIIGAIGMALIAQEVVRARSNGFSARGVAEATNPRHAQRAVTAFRGFDLGRTRFETREFVCQACSNICDMKEITIDGQKTYWGDKCSDKFRKRARTDRKPVIQDLLAFRDRALLDGFQESEKSERKGSGPTRIGIPRAMFFYDRFPFWRAYLETLGFQVVVSGPTDHSVATHGAELSVAEPCFPVQIAHGHVQKLLEQRPGYKPADYVLLPNVMDMEAPASSEASYLCPWNQTLPFMVRSAPAFSESVEKFLAPTIYFRLGPKHVKTQLAAYFARLGVRRKTSDAAVEAAYGAQATFTGRLLEAGREACDVLERTREPAVLLVGRPYNIYDRNGNCDIPRKLRDLYGVNVLPLDFLPLDEDQAEDPDLNMFWNSGRRILAAGRIASAHRNFHIIHITNFKCGPDSFIKHFLGDAARAPFLVLQFDGHGNDAGYLTRCEAYLDSKGVLRCPSHN